MEVQKKRLDYQILFLILKTGWSLRVAKNADGIEARLLKSGADKQHEIALIFFCEVVG